MTEMTAMFSAATPVLGFMGRLSAAVFDGCTYNALMITYNILGETSVWRDNSCFLNALFEHKEYPEKNDSGLPDSETLNFQWIVSSTVWLRGVCGIKAA